MHVKSPGGMWQFSRFVLLDISYVEPIFSQSISLKMNRKFPSSSHYSIYSPSKMSVHGGHLAVLGRRTLERQLAVLCPRACATDKLFAP